MLTEKIYCPCGRVVRIKQHEDGRALQTDRDARMTQPAEYCDACSANPLAPAPDKEALEHFLRVKLDKSRAGARGQLIQFLYALHGDSMCTKEEYRVFLMDDNCAYEYLCNSSYKLEMYSWLKGYSAGRAYEFCRQTA